MIRLPRRRIDAPTTARIGTYRPMGRSHFSFDGERKVCKRKPAARHYGKKASTAHFDGGARNVARDLVGQITPTLVRAPVLTFFRRQNGRAFFPSLPIAALLRRSWCRADSNGGAWDASLQLGNFCDVKCQRGFETTLAFLCEPEGLSPDGGLSYSTDKETTPDRRAVAPVVPRR